MSFPGFTSSLFLSFSPTAYRFTSHLQCLLWRGRGRGSVSEGQHTSVGLTEALPGSLSFVRGGRRWPLLSRCGRREERLDTGEKNRRKIYHTVNIILPTTWLFTLLVILQLSIKNTDLCCFNDFITILFIQQTFPTECHVLFAEVLLILW